MSVPRWTAEELDRHVASGSAVLADLRTDTCSRCGPQEKVLERLLPEYEGQVRIGSVDVAAHPSVAERYGVQGVPSFLLFAAGDHRGTLSGFRRAPELRQALRPILSTRRGA